MVMAAVVSGDVEAERCMLNECEQDVNVGLSLLQHRASSMHKVSKYSEDPDWSYDDPNVWSQSFPDCAGIAQSPIDFGPDTTGSREDEYPETLEATYEAVPSEGLKVVNNGHSIQVEGAFGELKLPDGLYKVLHFNFHCPSEHTVAGNRFPCEMQIVHQKEGSTGNADLAVVAIFFEEWSNLGSSEDAGIQLQFLRRLGFAGNLPEGGAESSIQSGLDIDLGVVFEKELIGHYWHYQGSLTSPPCSEAVHWYVLQNAAAISTKMVDTMKSLFNNGNSRGVQPVGEREVLGDFEEINDAEFPQAHLPGVPMHWTYGEPKRWGKGYEDCKGDAQSPINLKTPAGTPASDATVLSAMKYEKIPGSGLNLQNTGHAVQVDGNFGTLSLPDGEYEAKQFHFHFPSEHEVKGVNTVGEMHIVHQKVGANGTDGLAVIGILFDYVGKLGFNKETGRELAFLRGLGFGKGLPKEEEQALISNSEIDLAGVFEHSLNGPYWHYQGSLTTPPCSETVHWYVMEQRAAISPRMLRDFKDHFPDPMNNRPVQSLNGRTVAQSALTVGDSEFD
jgi:carbonic anhydrase